MRKKKRNILLSLICVVSILLTACSDGGKKAVVTCDGYEVKLGKTTVGDMKEAGFTNFLSGEEQLDGRTWSSFFAAKDDVLYGDMSVANKGSYKIEFDKGVIFEVILYNDNLEIPTGEVLVNGVNFEGYTKEEIKEAMGDAEIKQDSEDYLSFEFGGCNYAFMFEDGSETLTTLIVDDGTEKELPSRY